MWEYLKNKIQEITLMDIDDWFVLIAPLAIIIGLLLVANAL